MKLDALKLAIATGLASALALALLTLDAVYLGRGVTAVQQVLSPILPGYSKSLQGAGIGALYGFAVCFVYVWILALLYNKLLAFKGLKRAAKKKK